MHFSTPTHAAVQLWLSGTLMDSRDLVRTLAGNLPMLNVLRSDVFGHGSAWLAHYAPAVAVGRMISHAGFWEDPKSFNGIVDAFIATLPALTAEG